MKRAVIYFGLFLCNVSIGRTETLTVAPDIHCTNSIICETGGSVRPGVGFSFVPTQNLIVTRVGFMPEGNPNLSSAFGREQT